MSENKFIIDSNSNDKNELIITSNNDYENKFNILEWIEKNNFSKDVIFIFKDIKFEMVVINTRRIRFVNCHVKVVYDCFSLSAIQYTFSIDSSYDKVYYKKPRLLHYSIREKKEMYVGKNSMGIFLNENYNSLTAKYFQAYSI